MRSNNNISRRWDAYIYLMTYLATAVRCNNILGFLREVNLFQGVEKLIPVIDVGCGANIEDKS